MNTECKYGDYSVFRFEGEWVFTLDGNDGSSDSYGPFETKEHAHSAAQYQLMEYCAQFE